MVFLNAVNVAKSCGMIENTHTCERAPYSLQKYAVCYTVALEIKNDRTEKQVDCKFNYSILIYFRRRLLSDTHTSFETCLRSENPHSKIDSKICRNIQSLMKHRQNHKTTAMEISIITRRYED